MPRIDDMTATNTVYNVDQTDDYATAQEAITVVEAKGAGCVVKFRQSYNLPGCMPRVVCRSCAMWSYRDGKWYVHNIWDGYGNACGEEKPQ